MHSYRILVLTGLLVCILFHCDPKKTEPAKIDIKLYNWGNQNSVVFENGNYHSRKTLDTIANQLTGDTLIPITTFDSKIIIEELEPLHMELKTVDGVEDFYITKTGFKTDTFKYDVKTYFGRFFLILISESSSSNVYKLMDQNVNISETKNITFPGFKVEGYSIGDAVNREDIDVLFKDQFGAKLTEEALLKNNENVLLKIVNGLYIEEIQWINISESEAKKLIKELNRSFSYTPDIEYLTEEDQSEFEEILNYYWSENEVNVLLSKAKEFEDLDEVWSLTFTNLIVSNIIHNYLEELPEPI